MTADPQSESAPLGADRENPLFQFGSQEDRLLAVLHTVLLLLGAFVVAGLLQQGTVGLLAAAGLTESAAPALVSVSEMAANFAGFLAVGIGYIKYQECRSLVGLRRPSLRGGLVVVVGVVTLVVSLTGLQVLFAQLGYEPAQNSAVVAGEDNPQLYLYVIPVVLLLNSPGEELLFRGLIQGRFRRAYGVIPGILAAATVFGLVHLIALVGSGSELVYVTIAAVAGLLLGVVYELTQNLLVPIAVHALWNVGTYLVLYAGAVGAL